MKRKKREIELDVTVLWESMLRFKSLFKRQKEKACRDCAHLWSNFVGSVEVDGNPSFMESYLCKLDDSRIEKNELDSRFCKKFIRKKEGISPEQQVQNKLTSRLRRNWYYVIPSVAGIATVITLIIAVWKLLHP